MKTDPEERKERKLLAVLSKSIPKGYCIRTRTEIPFNLEKPLSDKAFDIWKKHNNQEYPEKYCHFSGEASEGEITYSKPILRKNWKKAKETFGL